MGQRVPRVPQVSINLPIPMQHRVRPQVLGTMYQQPVQRHKVHVRRGVQIPIQMVQPVRPVHLPVCARPDII